MFLTINMGKGYIVFSQYVKIDCIKVFSIKTLLLFENE